MENKIGVGIVTCNRPDFLRKLLDSISYRNDVELVIVNDGGPIDIKGYNYYIINNETNLGVGKSKNKAMQHLLDKGCDYIFIIEDDMLILNDTVFEQYIKAHKKTGIHHFMFGYHGPANKGNISGGSPQPKMIVDYGDLKVALNEHCVGAFCFYTRESLEKVGLMDDRYTNAFEHVDHSFVLAKNGFSTPYWWWSDIANSCEYIKEQACSEVSSSIRPRSDWGSNIYISAGIFETKHGVSPVDVPVASKDGVINFLRACKK